MRPSLDLQYRVKDLSIENVLVFIIRNHEAYLSSQDITSLKQINTLFEEMISDVIELRSIDFSPLKIPRLNYADQQSICPNRVTLATAGLIYYGLHPGMLVRYLKGEYVGETRSYVRVLAKVSDRIDSEDADHIKRILTLGCPAKLVLEEESSNKLSVIKKGNQPTFLANPEVAAKTMNKEKRYSHLIALRSWVVYFSPYLRCTPQGMREKRGKFRVIFDASTQSHQNELVLNQVTDSEFEAIIDFGESKMKLYSSIYNWRISFPNEVIYLVLADISACFRYPRIAADLTGAFGFMFEKLYFLSTSHVFGSNTSASSWEPFRRAIKNSIPIYFFRDDLVIKHKDLLDALSWDDSPAELSFVKAVRCELNKGVLNDDSSLSPPQAEIYVDDIMTASARKEWILRLLAAIIEAIFVVCGRPDIAVRQCPLSLEKWRELIVGPIQTILGLIVNTNKMTVRMSDEYLNEVRVLITEKWNCKRNFFRVNDMQKLVGKLARLGEAAPWVYKLMSHLYTSLASALKSNKEFLEKSSPSFKELCGKINKKQFNTCHSNLQREVCYAMKQAAKMINNHKVVYHINETMREELNLFAESLSASTNIEFETPIAFIIPRTPSASIFGDSSLLACGGYSLALQFWWHLDFPAEIISRTLLHIPNEKDERFISINCLEYVTIIVNYCAALIFYAENKSDNDDPHPVVLCVTDNMSAKKWTTHTCKKSRIGRALARFFCGLLIGSGVGINSTWISTKDNTIADEISRLKKSTSTNNPTSKPSYNYSELQQNYEELKACTFFQPSQELLSLIWEILLTRKCPDLNRILQLRPSDSGKLSTSTGPKTC